MRDIVNNVSFAHSLTRQTIATDDTILGSAVDLLGFLGAQVTFETGTVTDGDYVVTLLESDDNSTYTTVAAGDLQGSFPASIVAADDNKVYDVGYNGKKRYIKISVVSDNTMTGAVVECFVIRGAPRHAPV